MTSKHKLTESAIIIRNPPLNKNDILDSRFLHIQEKISESFLNEVSQTFISPYGVIFKNGGVLRDSLLNCTDSKISNTFTFYKKILKRKVKSVRGRCLVIHNVFYDNYYHWLLECMPRLFCVKEETKHLKLLIHEKLLPFHKFYLNLFEFEDIILIKDEELIKADCVLFPSHIPPELVHHEQTIVDMSAWIMSRIGVQPCSASKSVFISREKAKYRKAVNEEQLWPLFHEYGFHKVCMEELSVREQIALLAETKQLSGIHGAGFSNMMYMHQGKTFMDIMHRNYTSNGFYNLASVLKIDYILLQCEGTSNAADPRTDNLIVDIKKAETYLEKYFSEPQNL